LGNPSRQCAVSFHVPLPPVHEVKSLFSAFAWTAKTIETPRHHTLQTGVAWEFRVLVSIAAASIQRIFMMQNFSALAILTAAP
jgi:hypothetical protein